ncbi:NAD(P)-dependent oxidoreductase [Kribbella turkmenica]|uniref:NAD(P)-dependent oxidoreductase n=1 Tax=Kribbella turkmenica TaxID=2530375 RepID=A0A4R4XH44_9ACTN|nr:NAD(P)-dependent oxidoreductase [Kribbella turkmenica]TDD29802.1 NAD(P)-dependent oxidoreductase [Kribbella turkmenica]
MRIFVAGVSGAIGRLLVPLLLAAGHEVTALTRRDPAALRDRGVTAVAGDVYDADSLRGVVAAARPDIVMHQLTDLSTRDFAGNLRIRRVGTRNLVDAALAAGVRRVISQSISWAYEPGDEPADEVTPLDLAAPDDNRRASVEAVARLEEITAEAPEWVVLRYGMLYGPGTWYTRGGLMAEAGNLPSGPDLTSFLHVEDAAIAAVQALGWPTGPVNVVDDDPAPAATWAPVFAESVGAATPPPAGSARTAWARGASNDYARTRLAWMPTYPSWRTGFFGRPG